MKITDYVVDKVDRFQKGYVFTYSDFDISVTKKEAVIKALNRMAETGRISKLSKGRFFKAESTPFGSIMPSQFQVVKDLLEDDGKITGYLTGLSVYNQLGFTAQVSSVIQIGKNQIRPAFKRDRYKITFIRQINTITKESIPLLQLLDTLRYIKKIPDATIVDSVKRMLSILKSFSVQEKGSLVRLSAKYPPATRALLGAMLEELGFQKELEALKKTLNPITKYEFNDLGDTLHSCANWNIV